MSKDINKDVRELVLKTTPAYPSFPEQHEDTFKDSDEKSYSRMMNFPVIKRLIQREKQKQGGVSMTKNTRLKKVAMMPINMFQSQLDQISDKGRDVLKAIEDYKFFVDQASRVMKNDPALTEMIQGKKKNLEQSAQQIYDVVFDIENMDINSMYQRQENVTDENQNGEQNKQPENNNSTLEDKIDTSKPADKENDNKDNSQPSAPTPAVPAQNKPEQQTTPKPTDKSEAQNPQQPQFSRLKQKDNNPDTEGNEDSEKNDQKM